MWYLTALNGLNKNDSTPVMHEKITLKRTWWVTCLLFFGHPFELYYYQTIINRLFFIFWRTSKTSKEQLI